MFVVKKYMYYLCGRKQQTNRSGGNSNSAFDK